MICSGSSCQDRYHEMRKSQAKDSKGRRGLQPKLQEFTKTED
jgi:hypothetical protein